MQKKLLLFSKKESNTQSFNTKTDYERAKEIYFINFANHMTMKKNGEFKEYCKFQIPKETEREWSLEIKEKLMNEIYSGSDFLQVVNLSRINLPESEIIAAFELLVSSSQKDKILTTIEQLKPLFDAELYKKIVQLFK